MKHLLIFAIAICATGAQAQKLYTLTSPNGRIALEVTVGETVQWNASLDGTRAVDNAVLAMDWGYEMDKVDDTWGKSVKVKSAKTKSVSETIATPFYKRASVADVYNQLTIDCKGDYSIEFRAYDEGVAYRFVATLSQMIYVFGETAEFGFDKDYQAFIPYVNDNRSGERYCYSFESYYDECTLSQMHADSLAITPLAVCLDGGMKAVIMEAGVEDYPGMFLLKGEGNSLKAAFAPYPTKSIIGGHNRLNLIPTERAAYIARIGQMDDDVDAISGATAGDDGGYEHSFPWRVVLLTSSDTQLADNDMAMRLAPECRIDDTSWIRPGKVAWDWWNTCNLTGVDFEAGMNTPTYKTFIDFAAANGLEYIIIDEGWSGKESLLEDLNPEIDLPQLVAYGNEHGVGIIIWASWRNAGRNTEQAFKHYAQMGIKGFKIDFFDRDDQRVINSIERIADCAARHHLLLDLHGMKPYGIQRAYPNIVNFEGVKGLENAKWEPVVDGAPVHDFPRYDVTIPFLRMLPGPLDYTPGATQNATRADFRANNDHPMSQGTRAHQMAMYTIYEAPLQMLADSPSKYEKEQECTDFIAAVPTTFDETVALAGEMGEYVIIARRKGGTWYIGAMTNWNARDLTVDLSFLGEGSYNATIFADGANAHREATDYKRTTATVTSGGTITVHLAPGGGWTAILSPQQ